ncbi:NUDIX hydrolase [Mycetocola reblochoni]|uniref:Nudix-related transcriptional regulator NrtR n=2 Tax=Mycetocola reblochoni TaxID=331618 RepID=A0A1R4IKV5_9MICO|nr:NUDIX domain-containing protein [Mycetocola reblochoni]RLP70135.1 NUDIX hydrolase [Mycetocola reblochoni]SJN20510.1 Nudix-related transcriptional regulator NrtR [Mycetocola reblochoni REB411]
MTSTSPRPGTDTSGAGRTPRTGDSATVQLAVSTVIFTLHRAEAGEAPRLWIPLVRRIREPFKGLWALPGGPLLPDEDLASSAARTLAATTGLSPRYLEQLYAFGAIDRSPDDRVVSIVYWALVGPDEAVRTAERENVRWVPADALTGLAFDHDRIVAYALWRLRSKLEYSQVAHALVGELFTLAELRSVYESILGSPLDPANFRRHVEASGVIEATEQYRTGGRHRPARLYRTRRDVRMADDGPLSEGQGPRPSGS